MYRLGFDIGGTNIAFGIVDEKYRIIYKSAVRFPHTSPEDVATLLNKLYLSACEDSGTAASQIDLIGICIPGSIDKLGKNIINAYNLNFHQVPFKDIVERCSGIEVRLTNDADAATLAEHRIGSLKGTQNAILITIGTGIGGGIVLNGKLFHGGKQNGIELGHMIMDLHGKRCTCGRIGCVETLCSATYLNNKARELYNKDRGGLRQYHISEVDCKLLVSRAMNGDEDCYEIWDEYLNCLSEALASYINLYDPERIAIGGGLSGAGDFLIKPLNKRAAEKCFFKDNPPEIVCAMLGNDAGILGAIMN